MTIQRPSDKALATHRTIEITTVGRRTGEPRRMEIWWFYIEPDPWSSIPSPPGGIRALANASVSSMRAR